MRIPYGNYSKLLIRGFDSDSKDLVEQPDLVFNGTGTGDTVYLYFEISSAIDWEKFHVGRFDLIIFRNMQDFACFENAVYELQENENRVSCDFLDNPEDSTTKSVYMESTDYVKILDPIIVSEDWDNDQVGEMLIVIDNSAWPEALTDETWTKERIERDKDPRTGGLYANTVDISVFTIFPDLVAKDSNYKGLLAATTVLFIFFLVLFMFILWKYNELDKSRRIKKKKSGRKKRERKSASTRDESCTYEEMPEDETVSARGINESLIE